MKRERKEGMHWLMVRGILRKWLLPYFLLVAHSFNDYYGLVGVSEKLNLLQKFL
jgi:hypothetical protein